MIEVSTGLFNRRYLHAQLPRELRLSRHGGRPMSVIACDLDRFKPINDSHGHAVADLVLRETAPVMTRLLSGLGGVLGRLGSDEFALLLPGLCGDAARDLAERLRLAVAGHGMVLPVGPPEHRNRLAHQQTLSLSVAEWQAGMLDGSDLLELADRKLYDAKRAGRNRVSG